MPECRAYNCNRPVETEDEYGKLCNRCADELELAAREENEAACEEALDASEVSVALPVTMTRPDASTCCAILTVTVGPNGCVRYAVALDNKEGKT